MLCECTSSKHQKGYRLQPLLWYFLVSRCLLLYLQFELLRSSLLLAKHQQVSSLVVASTCGHHSIIWQRLCPLSNQQLVTSGDRVRGPCCRAPISGPSLSLQHSATASMTAVSHLLFIPQRRHYCLSHQHTPPSAVVRAGPFSIKHPIFEKGYHHGAPKYSRMLLWHDPRDFLTHGLCDLQLPLFTTQKRWILERSLWLNVPERGSCTRSSSQEPRTCWGEVQIRSTGSSGTSQEK